ncbi:hypothetical protein BU16DRAFT_525131 [Lophium mytilinum]|uniref:Uncharacterized protein n=1 Tax=Lophium mytilinum TaxID=390894 RepID=A0A6A6QZE4_9PEZI|nr:hypothetical protein BU16DRAFT_525131 [Lophium mytilinum]
MRIKHIHERRRDWLKRHQDPKRRTGGISSFTQLTLLKTTGYRILFSTTHYLIYEPIDLFATRHQRQKPGSFLPMDKIRSDRNIYAVSKRTNQWEVHVDNCRGTVLASLLLWRLFMFLQRSLPLEMIDLARNKGTQPSS